jgi:hypothetical protein
MGLVSLTVKVDSSWMPGDPATGMLSMCQKLKGYAREADVQAGVEFLEVTLAWLIEGGNGGGMVSRTAI